MYGTLHSFFKPLKSVQTNLAADLLLIVSIKFDFASALNLRWNSPRNIQI
jgi:hypothetical protein